MDLSEFKGICEHATLMNRQNRQDSQWLGPNQEGEYNWKYEYFYFFFPNLEGEVPCGKGLKTTTKKYEKLRKSNN